MSDDGIVRVGILAVQGDFAEHEESFRAAARAENSEVVVERVRLPADLAGLHGLVLPGGESTVMTRFLLRHGLAQSVRDWMRGDRRRQIWGTCAGLILLADKVIDTRLGTGHGPDTEPGQGPRHGLETYCDVDAPQLLGCLSISVVRNSYGGQRDSFESDVFISSDRSTLNDDNGHTEVTSCRGIFIRAPGIKSVNSSEVKVLGTIATDRGDQVVAVEQNNMLGTSFHPELTDDVRWHRYFLQHIRDALT